MRPVRLAGAAIVLALLVPAAPAAGAQWLAGDGHVHTCYSHDAWCGPGDDNTGPDTFYSSGGTVDQRFTEAAAKGLDFLVVSDHNDVRAWSDPAFGSRGVVGVRAYEHSLDGGHAHVLGPPGTYGDLAPADLLAAAHADGALLQANHPAYRAEAPLDGCEQIGTAGSPLDWEPGFDVRPDLVEVWNPTALIAPAELFWECWLERGARLPATAGSDTHGATQPTVGLPTTWVLAGERSEAAVLAALRAGRTTLTRLPPGLGGAPLLLEADADRDGTYEATVGDTVAPGTPMRVRSRSLAAAGTLRVRANGATLRESFLLPGATVRFDAPAATGWVRATLLASDLTGTADPNCEGGGPAPANGFDLCTGDLAYLAMTSPVYLGQT
jgi:predicted metal-dependent phosphoesterase TrpH